MYTIVIQRQNIKDIIDIVKKLSDIDFQLDYIWHCPLVIDKSECGVSGHFSFFDKSVAAWFALKFL